MGVDKIKIQQEINKMATIKMSQVDTLPEISRAGRQSEELVQIINALNESVKTNKPFSMVGIKAGNAYNSMQQRIRAQAKKLGYKIVIRFDSATETLYFQATKSSTTTNTSVNSNEVGGIKTKPKTK